MHGSGFREAARESMRKAGKEGKMTKTMAVTKEQLKVVFEIGAASEGTNFEEVKFSQKLADLFVHEKFEKADNTIWLKSTLIAPSGLRIRDFEGPMNLDHPIWPW